MFKIVVLVSGTGSNLQALINAVSTGKLNACITTVIADRSVSALERAAASGIATQIIDRKIWGKKLSGKILEKIPEDTDLIVLAGFLSILNSVFVKRWLGKIINIHPSLLPDFGGKGMYGKKVHESVIKSGRTMSGCSVHYVDAGVDTGKIIMQRKVAVLDNDSPETLGKRILAEEHRLLVDAVAAIINRR